MSFRNRCVIASNNGLVSLTVPLKNGREQKVLITEVKIDNSQNWQRQHWRTIHSCYRKAPFFDYYAAPMEELIFSKTENLFELNLVILKWIENVLKISIEISFTPAFKKEYPQNEYLDLRNHWLPKNFQQQTEVSPKYSQVFEDKIGFQPNLSILDLLFCEGPNTKNLLVSNF
jgi:hypothetical protein